MHGQKTHKGLRKRVKITGRGKVKRHKSFTGHLLSGRSSKTKRKLHRTSVLTPGDAHRVYILLGGK